MSDFFELPVNQSQLEVYGANSNEAISFDEIESAAAFAINNHDKLVEALKVNHEWLSINAGYIGSPLCEKNIELLKELGHEI